MKNFKIYEVCTVEYVKENEITVLNGYLDIGLKDTMKDLMVNFLGAIIFNILGYLYLKNREKYSYVEKIMIKRKEA